MVAGLWRGRLPLRLIVMALKLALALAVTAAALVLGILGALHLTRPAQTALEQPLYEGVHYRRLVKSTPRALMVHVVEVDLQTPGVRLLVTPSAPHEGHELRAQTTRAFLAAHKLQLAINGSFFEPFHSDGPFDFYPHSGDPVNVIGQSTSQGVTYSTSDGPRGTLCIEDASGEKGVGSQGKERVQTTRASVVRGRCPAGVSQAIAGHLIVLEQGQPVKVKATDPEPRTLVGLDKTGQRLTLVVVDGRQPEYSEGLSLTELAPLAQELGLYTALNLDGGGSTTLARAREGLLSSLPGLPPVLLNAPIHTRILMRERPVANHLGVYANGLKAGE